MNMVDSPNCRLCSSNEETMLHLFVECQVTSKFLADLILWVNTKLDINIEIKPFDFLLGYLLLDQHFIPMNTLYILAKYYIFICAYNQRSPNILEFQQ